MPGQRPGHDVDLVAPNRDDLTPADPAILEHVQGSVAAIGAEQAHPRIDPEHVETVMRQRPSGIASAMKPHDVPARRRNRSTREFPTRGRVDSIQQPVTEPVRLDDPPVQRIRDSSRDADQLEVRPSASKALGQFRQASVHDPRRAVLEHRGAVGRPTVPALVRRIGVAGEQCRPGDRPVRGEAAGWRGGAGIWHRTARHV